MPGLNLTGTPNTSDYTLGRGKVYFGTLDANGLVTEYRDVGNCPAFKVSMTNQKLQHFSSQIGLKTVDKEVIISQEMGVALSLDEISFDNMAFFFSGDTGSDSAAAAIAGVVPSGGGNLRVFDQGRWYDLYKPTTGKPASDTSGQRIYDITFGAVKDTGDSTTYVAGTDYITDPKMGRIFIPVGSAMVGDPAVGVLFMVHISAHGGAAAPARVRAFTNAGKAIAVKFLLDNPTASDQITEFQFHSVTLFADGDFSLIEDKFTEISLKGVAGTNATADPASTTLTIRTHANAHS